MRTTYRVDAHRMAPSLTMRLRPPSSARRSCWTAPQTLHRVARRAPGDQLQDPVLTAPAFVFIGLVTRTAYPGIPPRVEYQLTREGTRLQVGRADLWRWPAAPVFDP
ncbi:hypothetical protein STRTUCAR8_00107 [Streptomyces turgidiscabies Car8]|uniref:HTH hxlR-type domain-containing protein n=3 Tax=Streptomyces TaxID=1883 RepID=L7FCX5_STRT8|nr:hypothetical protein STRTUCAR8_00107 [Streptomyces turgidiscabies Car8]